ncbi:MAG: regulatory iron-sulfur-containing complex subunit RicT [Bacteroidota bacterium]|jgi:cell fate regulator YaaT (PSP1 superfamily)|nr:regulatory iron-sulfur-containing complex subunit RicT [Bacteroidota bacterium]
MNHNPEPSQNEERERKEVPLELHKLDDAVLVYTSEDGDVVDVPSPESDCADGDGGHPDSCCHEQEQAGAIEMAPFVEVMFKGERRGYYFNEQSLELAEGMHVVVEAEKGLDLGVICSIGDTAYMKSRLRQRPCAGDMKKIVRPADEADLKIVDFHREQEHTAFNICLDHIHKLDLPMKLVDVEYQFDRNRITFYFTADGRVDFRQLVRELASEYRTRIELRQIGPRDEAKRMGGFGVCGRELCCSSWLNQFEPISTDMARLQNLTINPFKLAGQCGRLKCCLSYEAQLYEELLKRFPPLDYRISSHKGEGVIEKIDIFLDAIYVHYAKDNSWERLTLDEVNAIIANPIPPSTESSASRTEGRSSHGKQGEGKHGEGKRSKKERARN